MKLLIFASVLAVAASYPVVKTWVLHELSNVIEKESDVDQEMRPYLIEALDQIMLALFTGKGEEKVHAVVLSPTGKKKWTVAQLKAEIANPTLPETIRPFYVRAYPRGKPENDEDQVELVIPALDISTWTISDLNEAIEDPDTKPALRPFLENAKEEFKEAIEAGEKKENVTLITPVGLIPQKGTPTPIIVARTI